MKTTLDLNDTLVAEAKSAAARQRTTLTRIVEEGLRLRLQERSRVGRAKPVRIPVLRGEGGLQSVIDPRSNKSILSAHEGSNDA